MKAIQLSMSILFLMIGFAAFAQDYRVENNEVKIAKQVSFKTGTAELLPGSEEALLLIKKYLQEKTYISLLRVEAHTAIDGDAVANQLLTEKRAAAICQKLISMGIACSRLLPVGFGGTKPVAENTPEGKVQNNRIVFVNAALRDKAIGGMPADGGGKVAENPCY